VSDYIQITGLVIDIIGAGFMAWDIVFYDEKVLGTWAEFSTKKKDKRKAKRNTLIGLGLISLGFLLQIISILV
jgi:hypothetical protein